MNRAVVVLASVSLLSLGPAGVGHAQGACDPKAPRLVESTMVRDSTDAGFLDRGDAFRLVLDEPVDVFGPSFGITFVDADGRTGFLGDQSPDIFWSVEGLTRTTKHGKVTKTLPDQVIDVTDVFPYWADYGEDSWRLPVTITDVSGVYLAGPQEDHPVDAQCGKDLTLE